ncbi:MAG: hypothetical protein R6V85_02745 [Polyangia bacterium]
MSRSRSIARVTGMIMAAHLLAACDDGGGTAADAGDADSDTATEGSSTVTATVRLVDAVGGGAPQGATVTFDGDPVEVEGETATGEVPAEAPFELLAEATGYADYMLNGRAGQSDFTLTSFVSSRSTTDYVMGSLGMSVDASKGFVVVGVDTPALEPVVGARVEIGSDHDDPFVFAGSTPQLGDTIPDGGASFVSFPNVEPGTASIAVTPPDGLSCAVFPGPGELSEIEVYADRVSVISYTCQ